MRLALLHRRRGLPLGVAEDVMGRPEERTVHLMAGLDGRAGPADGHDVRTGHAWVWVAMVDGEVVVFNSDDGPHAAMAVLARVPDRTDFAQYWQDDDRPDVYRYVGNLE